jgi:ribosome-associated toxin RatA of RatAB toxin-antitoxin module
MLHLFFVLAFLLPLAVSAEDDGTPEKLQTTVTRRHQDGHDLFHIEADGFTRATPQRAWEVLTAYEQLPEFVPNMRSSKLLSRHGEEVMLEQQSRTRFLFIKQDIHVVLRVTEHPLSAIDIALVSSDEVRQYTGRWELTPAQLNGVEGTHIRYTGDMEPRFFVPPVLGASLVKGDVRRMVSAVIARIDKQRADVGALNQKRDAS